MLEKSDFRIYNYDDKNLRNHYSSLSRGVWITTSFDKSNFIKEKHDNRLFYLSPEIQLKTNLEGSPITKYLKTTHGRILLNKSFEYNQ